MSRVNSRLSLLCHCTASSEDVAGAPLDGAPASYSATFDYFLQIVAKSNW